ncbi:MAG: prepilin peptidase [Lachnospiraceae bacterium]|nr:prepilin peptidase [Lachnospiraceae bacterium]
MLLLLAALADLKTDRIPNGFILLGIILGLSGSLWTDKDLWKSIGSMLLAFLLLYPIYKIGALGAGDVKLFIMIGSFYAVKESMVILAGAFVIGAVFSLIKLLAEHNGRERMQYFLSYLSEVMLTKQWKLYGEDLIQDYHMYRRNKIHFAVPILFSAVLKVGGLL